MSPIFLINWGIVLYLSLEYNHWLTAQLFLCIVKIFRKERECSKCFWLLENCANFVMNFSG